VRVAAGHLHNPSTARVLLEGLQGEFDALSVATYFGVKADRAGLSMKSTAAEIMANARTGIDDVLFPRLDEHFKLAEQAGKRAGKTIPVVIYEGGQSIIARKTFGADRSLSLDVKATAQCQTSLEMYDCYKALLKGLRERGVALFNAYDFVGENTHADTFGHLTWLGQPLDQAPKMRALLEE
jgi:hypothetical protein